MIIIRRPPGNPWPQVIARPMSFRAERRYTGKNRRPADFVYGGYDMDYKLELVLIPVSDVDRGNTWVPQEVDRSEG